MIGLKFVGYLFWFLLFQLRSCSSLIYDCCQPSLSSTGLGCSTSGTFYDNATYYCVSVSLVCPSCEISSDAGLTSSSCYQCCVTDPESCGTAVSVLSTSSWSKFSLQFLINVGCELFSVLFCL